MILVIMAASCSMTEYARSKPCEPTCCDPSWALPAARSSDAPPSSPRLRFWCSIFNKIPCEISGTTSAMTASDSGPW